MNESHPLVGISTSVLRDKSALDDLLAYEPEVVEFINYPTSALPDIRQFVSHHGIGVALHTPVPSDGPPLRRYDPTGNSPGAAEQAKQLLLATVRCAEAIEALHVVVHFPSPHPPFDAEAFHQYAGPFLDAAEDASLRHGVPVLIENLTPNPLCRTAQQYRSILADRPGLGFCLDVGHAHLLEPHDGPLSFAKVLGPRIRSLHLYNTSVDRYPSFGHEMINPRHSVSDGFLDVEGLLRTTIAMCNPSTVVLEHDPGGGDPSAVTRWIRSVRATEAVRNTRGSGRNDS